MWKIQEAHVKLVGGLKCHQAHTLESHGSCMTMGGLLFLLLQSTYLHTHTHRAWMVIEILLLSVKL